MSSSRPRFVGPALASLLVTVACGETGVAPVEVSTVVVSPSLVTLVEADSTALSASPRDALGNVVQGRSVVWAVLDTAVAAISAQGMVRARAVGRTVVEARVDGRVGRALLEVVARDVTPRLFAVSPAEAMEGDSARVVTLLGERFAVGAVVLWNGAEFTATVDSATRASVALPAAAFAAHGVATIALRNTDGAISNVLTVPVHPAPVTTVDISPDSLVLDFGQWADLSVAVRGPGGRALTGRVVIWLSGDSDMVHVSGGGRVTARDVGTTFVRATVEGVSAEIPVRVRAVSPPVGYVVVQPSVLTTLVGVTVQFRARVLGLSGVELPGRTVTWSLEDSTIARIAQDGSATGVLAGATRVFASVDGVEGSAELQVRDVPSDPHVYDLRLTDPFKPIVGDTVWTLPGSGEQPATVVLDRASLEMGFSTGRYRQVFTYTMIVGTTIVSDVERVDEGSWSYRMDGTYDFTSTTTPGRTFRVTPGGVATLLVFQTVWSLPERYYTYVLR